MTPLVTLKRAVKILERKACHFCLIGGHAASLYRTQERLTRDVDFALVADPVSNSRKLAEQVIEEIGLIPVVRFIPPSAKEGRRKSVYLITSKAARDESKGVIDILLPVLPWIFFAVERAQHNRIAMGFASVPVITPEDLIIAKCYALRNSPDRFQDLDDIKEIFIGVNDLDFDYIHTTLKKHSLSIPQAVRKFAVRK